MIPQPIDQVPLFLKLTEDERELLSSRLRHIEFNPNDVIFTANKPAEFFGVIAQGWVKLETETPQGPVALANLGAGSVIGEVDLLLNRAHSTSSRAGSATNLLVLNRQDLQEIILERPTIGLKFSSGLGTRVAYLDEYLATQRLGAVPLLSSLSEEEMRAMASQLQYRLFQRGETLFEAGAPVEAVYLIEEGKARLISPSRDGDSFDEFTEGDLLGHTALITGKPLASTARAVTDLSVWVLNRRAYTELIAVHPSIKVAFSRALAEGLDSGDQEKAIEQLRSLPLFADVEEEALQGIAGCLVLRHFPAGELVYTEGTPGDAMYFVESGEVRLVSDAATEAEFLDRKHAGESFGEMALLTGRTRAEAAKALTDTTLWVLYKSDYDDLMVQYPSLSLALSRALSGRLLSLEGDSVERHLHGVKLFEGLSQAELKEVSAFVKPLRFRPGETICQAGQPAQYIYLIEAGEVREIAGVNGQSAVVTFFGAQQCFGERAVFQNSLYPTTMQAVGEVNCWTMAKPDFDRAMSRYSALALNVARSIAAEADRAPKRAPRPGLPPLPRPNSAIRSAPAYPAAPVYANAPRPPQASTARTPAPPRAPTLSRPAPIGTAAPVVGVRAMPGKPWEQSSSTVLRPMPAANSRPIGMNGTAVGAPPVVSRRRRANGADQGLGTRIATMSTSGKIKLAIVGIGVPLGVLFLLLLIGLTIVAQAANFGGFSGGSTPNRDLPANLDDPSAPVAQVAGIIQNTGKMAVKVRTATPTSVPPTAVPTVKPTVKPARKPAVQAAPKALAPKQSEAPMPPAPVAAAAAIVRPPLPPREWDSRLGSGGLPLLLGIGVKEAQVSSGQTFWRLVRMKFQDAGAESGNDHTIYVSIIDENGQRLDDQTVVVSWDEGGALQTQHLGITDQKANGDYCNCNYNWPMYGAGYRVRVDGTLPSDEPYGMIMPEHRHVNYLLTFQRAIMP